MMRKRILGILLSLVLALGLFPTMAYAAEAHWAEQAVTTLNGIYGNGVFAASDDAMSVSDLQTVLEKMGSTTDVTLGDTLTRGTACEVLADIFDLPVDATIDEGKAINYLYRQNIINGYADGDLGADDSVSLAQFAVITYRVLNYVGGGMGSSNTALKPGTKEYFAWMYLAARRCVPFIVDSSVLNGIIENTTVNTYIAGGGNITYADKTGQDLWNAWIARLDELSISHSGVSYNVADTVLQAAVKLTEATGAEKIFNDVSSEDWFYDGVMYLFDRQIIAGNGDGTFAPSSNAPLFQFAVLMTQADDAAGKEGAHFVLDTELNETNPDAARNKLMVQKINYAVNKGYILGKTSLADKEETWNPAGDSDWNRATTREEAVYGILKQQGRNVTGVNTAILERFSDTGDVTEDAKPYMAYAVSAGLISGERTGDEEGGILAPKGATTRAQIGVLLYRNLIGLDSTKMQDYRENVDMVLPTAQGGDAA